jgi:hypothetical protein
VPDSAVLQVLIGLALVFAVFSVAVSRANEAVLGFLNYRGRQLEIELRRLTSAVLHRTPVAAASVAPAGQPPADATQPAPAPADAAPATAAAAPRDLAAELLDGPLRALRTGGKDAVPAVTAMPPAQGWFDRIHRARVLRLPTYLPSTAFARAVLDLVEPPARALLARVTPAELASVFPTDVTASQRDAYARAYLRACLPDGLRRAHLGNRRGAARRDARRL